MLVAMGTSKVRVGVVGAGANTVSRHLPGLLQQPDVELASVCNRSRESSERVAQQFGIGAVYESWPELVAADDSDAIVIGTWPYLHCPITLAALHAGKHVLCEARMAMNAGEARAMLAASRHRPELVAQIVPAPHTLGEDGTMRRYLSEGRLGDLLAVELIDSSTFRTEGPLHWRHQRELSGLNIMTLGIWYEAMLRWAGPATRVAAFARTFVPVRADADGVRRAVPIPDHIDVLGDLACGAQLRMQVSQVTGLRPSGAWLCGSEGTLHRDADGGLHYGARGDSALAPVAIEPQDVGAWRVEEEFINTIRGLEQVSHTRFADGVQYMEFTAAVHRSLESGRAAAVAGL